MGRCVTDTEPELAVNGRIVCGRLPRALRAFCCGPSCHVRQGAGPMPPQLKRIIIAANWLKWASHAYNRSLPMLCSTVSRDEEGNTSLQEKGPPAHAANASKKPRSRGIFHSLFCCVCHDEADQLPVNNNAPLLVEENGTVSKCLRWCLRLAVGSVSPLKKASRVEKTRSSCRQKLGRSERASSLGAVECLRAVGTLSAVRILGSVKFLNTASRAKNVCPLRKAAPLKRENSECHELQEEDELSEYFVITQQRKSSEHSEVPEERELSEQSEDSEPCECEFCVPPVGQDQVPAKPLLPQIKSKDVGKICVVIDLDETLVHSSFKPVNNADFIIPVEIDGTVHQVYVLKRPHVDEFLKRMGELFECVLFTASLAKYADPVSDLLDKWGAFRSRLFRESCVFHRGNYVKDLSRLGRDLNKVIIVDNSPASYIFHPDNAVPVASWFDDMSDTELLDLIPFFERLSKVDDVYTVLKQQRTIS
ncbi:hypothetical protein MATL_G00146340 [Megalops atlanticus]|uniref:protein-serine/threonine phosphatase n=1 Tax=Megalops atlanticus TaxID=7932 RepID=A0A9D3T4Q4_MEGAT|nr:hypothetical protein MATL_G00146340 [Megalops atlanticus]